MPSSGERRTIQFFIDGYNSVHARKIIDCKAGQDQEAPDAVCAIEDGRRVALELTSVYLPKGVLTKKLPFVYDNLDPIRAIIKRKFLNHYRDDGIDEAWLVVHIRRTLQRELITGMSKDIVVPSNFNRVFLQWPVPLGARETRLGVLDLPSQSLWFPS